MKLTLNRRNTLKILFFGSAAGLVVVLLLMWLMPPDSQASLPHANLIIERSGGQKVSFDVEIATTEEEKARGLMFRRTMPADAGMLFLFEPLQAVNFWMKDTYIPLDMLFIRADGTIEKITTHIAPFSLSPLTSGEPIRGVVEVNAGEADRRGIQIGDKAIYPAFNGR